MGAKYMPLVACVYWFMAHAGARKRAWRTFLAHVLGPVCDALWPRSDRGASTERAAKVASPHSKWRRARIESTGTGFDRPD
jgi:hypothetical protein